VPALAFLLECGVLDDANHALTAHVYIFHHAFRKIRYTNDLRSQRIEQFHHTFDAFVEKLAIFADQDVTSVEQHSFKQLHDILWGKLLDQHPYIFKTGVIDIKVMLALKVNLI
jgi:hypothetical protein